MSDYPKWMREAAWEIMGNPILESEGEPGISDEEEQDRYDENEFNIQRQNEICEIIQRHLRPAMDEATKK